MGDCEKNQNAIATGSSSQQTLIREQKPLRCIVKLGGAAITNKNELESINEENLRSVCAQLRESMTPNFGNENKNGIGIRITSPKFVGMDWSKRNENENENISVDINEILQTSIMDSNCIIVHGAGSFGHFQASKSGVHRGGLNSSLVKAGFVATRISVTSLNHEIVRALAREGIPAVGISPFACGWSAQQRKIASANASQIVQSLQSGFIPVMHGDAVLDHSQDCTILSGDVIIRHLAELFRPKYVVFLTDVHGVYDRPPTNSNSVLLREILVSEDGSWSVVKPVLDHSQKGVEITVSAHDTTGGMETKILEAASIAKLGIDVFITKVGTEHSLRALKGEVYENSEDWLGTVIRSAN